MKKQTTSNSGFMAKSKKRNPGVHSKSKTSSNKNSRNYKKSYKGQGR